MQVECPHCNTVFQLSNAQLDQAEGQVRCGHCLAIFTASDYIKADHQPVKPEQTKPKPVDLDIDTLADALPGDEQTDTKPVLSDVIPPELRAETRSRKKHYGFLTGLLSSLIVLTLLASGILQYAFYNRFTLIQKNELRPWLGMMCQYMKCDLPDPRDPKRIELSSKNIFSHPNNSNALMIAATIVNQAEFEQDFPLLELRFENIRGQLIAGRQFQPTEYLNIPKQQISKMEPGNPVSFNIEIMDPGKDMVSYAFEFL